MKQSHCQLPTETARVFFLSHSLKKKLLFLTFSCFSYLFNASTRRFRTLSSASHVKYYLISRWLKSVHYSCICSYINIMFVLDLTHMHSYSIFESMSFLSDNATRPVERGRNAAANSDVKFPSN